MGCLEDRGKIIYEEIELRSKADALGFSHISSEVMDLKIRKYSAGTSITIAQMRYITSQLRIAGSESLDAGIGHFYEELMDSDSSFRRQNFILICILLGNSSNSVKANLIFESFDEDASRKMELSEFDEMWTCLVDNALTYLPALLTPPSKTVVDYIDKCRRSIPTAKALVKAELFGEEQSIDKAVFRYRVTQSKMRMLLAPHTLRIFTFPLFKNQIEKTPIQLGRGIGMERKDHKEDIDRLMTSESMQEKLAEKRKTFEIKRELSLSVYKKAATQQK